MGEQEDNKETERDFWSIFAGIADLDIKTRNVSEEERKSETFFEKILREIYYGNIGRELKDKECHNTENPEAD